MALSESRGSSRAIVIGIVALYVWTLLAAFGGFGTGVQSASAEYEYGPGLVTVCHKGKTIMVSGSSLQMHLGHGDTVGPCH